MPDHPIMFKGPMVRAILEGRKTQTRRVITPRNSTPDGVPRINIGDRLWVREAWRSLDGLDGHSPAQMTAESVDAGWRRPWAPIQYEADGKRDNWYHSPPSFGIKPGRIRASMHMPRWASRLTLKVTDVRVERLQDISERNAIAEGLQVEDREFMPRYRGADNLPWFAEFPRDAFKSLWDSINGKRGFGWDVNPWVIAVAFTKVEGA